MDNVKWVLIRNGEVRQVFDNRREAVKYFKEVLKQVLKDFDKQDKTDEFDYSIKFPETKIIPIHERGAFLGL